MGTCNPHLAVLTASQFAAAYRGYFHQTVNYLRASGSNAERAEELAQAAWARGWEFRDQLRDCTAVQSWVCAIARNRARNVRNALQHTAVEADMDALPAGTATRAELEADEILSVMRALPETYREPLAMRFLAGLSGAEIAAQLGMTAGSVRVNLCRGLKLLRDRLGAGDVHRVRTGTAALGG